MAGSAPETAGFRQGRSPTSWVASRRSVPLGGHRRLVVPGWHGLRFMVAGCAPVAVSAAGRGFRCFRTALAFCKSGGWAQVRSRSIWTTVMCASRRSTTRTRRERVVVPDRVRAVLADRFGPGVELHLGEVDRFQGLRIPRRRSAGQLAGVDRDGVAVVGDARALTPRRVACGWSPARRCRRRR